MIFNEVLIDYLIKGALAKERREQKMTDRQAADNDVPTGNAKNWNDPLPAGVTDHQVIFFEQ